MPLHIFILNNLISVMALALCAWIFQVTTITMTEAFSIGEYGQLLGWAIVKVAVTIIGAYGGIRIAKSIKGVLNNSYNKKPKVPYHWSDPASRFHKNRKPRESGQTQFWAMLTSGTLALIALGCFETCGVYGPKGPPPPPVTPESEKLGEIIRQEYQRSLNK